MGWATWQRSEKNAFNRYPERDVRGRTDDSQVFGRRIVDFLARNVGDLKKQGGLAWLFVLPIESDAKFHPACPLCHGAHAGL